MRCNKCHRKYDSTLDFCPKCGMENNTGLRGETRALLFNKKNYTDNYKENIRLGKVLRKEQANDNNKNENRDKNYGVKTVKTSFWDLFKR